jgi:hypothetical protein
MIVSDATFEVSAPMVDSQIVQMESADVGVLLTIAVPEFASSFSCRSNWNSENDAPTRYSV